MMAFFIIRILFIFFKINKKHNMKKHVIILVLILQNFLISKSGHPPFSNFSGGYLGFSINYDTQQTIGFQLSLSIVIPTVGEASIGPYLFPGIVHGVRYSLNSNKSIMSSGLIQFLVEKKRRYSYTDLQLLYFNSGVWGGVAKGKAFYNGLTINRDKLFGGYLMFGAIIEKMPLNKEEQYYKALHFGLAMPLIGNHFYP